MVLMYRRLEFNHKYFISNRGFIISLVRRFRLLNIRRDKNGYVHYYIRDTVTGKRKDYKGHRLVVEAFIPNPNKLPIINHIDGNKSNNHVENLEWCTQSYNNIHSYETGLHVPGYKACVINGEFYKSQSEAAEKLGVCRHTVDNWIKLGKGYYIKCD